MAETTVKKLADVVGIPVDTLLAQMREAGLPHTDAGEEVSDEQKQQLLAHLRKSHGAASDPKKITLKRRSTSTIRTTGAAGKAKTVNVEVRKRRTYVKRAAIEEEERLEAERKAAEEEAERLAEEEKRKAEEEERRKAQEEEALRREQEARARAEKERQAEDEKASQEKAKRASVPKTTRKAAKEETAAERKQREAEERKQREAE